MGDLNKETVARIYALRQQQKDIEKEVKELTESLQAYGVDKYNVGPYILELAEQRRFDANKAAAVLKPGQAKLVSKTVIDSAKAKAMYPDLYPKMQTVYKDKKVLVTLPDD